MRDKKILPNIKRSKYFNFDLFFIGMNNVKFNFWCPVDISKAVDPATGKEIMRLGGIASTADRDSDGEFLDPKGFDIKPLIEKGMVNWHHQAKDKPATIVGEPSKAEIRKDGLYIETDLYPSSETARDIYTLAEVLKKDSKTRRLGYSIEGKVVERDKKNPKIIKKAIITGVAITHMPKNPKTFADIIKGEIDDFDEDEEKEKSFDTEDGKSITKESVNKKVKVTLSKAEVMERLFQDIPGLEIEKAEEIYKLIKTIQMANKEKKSKRVTDEDIQKAYDALGLENPSPATVEEEVQKGDDADLDDETTEDVEDTEEADGGEEETEKGKKKEVKKGGLPENRFDRIEKAMEDNFGKVFGYVKALGVLVKSQAMENSALRKQNEELLDVVKGYEDEFQNLHEGLDKIGREVPARKSVSSAKAVEKFAKGDTEGDIQKGENVLSISQDRGKILDILDNSTFEKGYDVEFSKATQVFESSGQLPVDIIARLKREKGIDITK